MSISVLLKLKAELEGKIAQAKAESHEKAIAEVKQVMGGYELTATDLSAARPANARLSGEPTRRPVAVKYKDDKNNTCTDHGLTL
jgi:DNA-binding protein H-NS